MTVTTTTATTTTATAAVAAPDGIAAFATRRHRRIVAVLISTVLVAGCSIGAPTSTPGEGGIPVCNTTRADATDRRQCVDAVSDAVAATATHLAGSAPVTHDEFYTAATIVMGSLSATPAAADTGVGRQVRTTGGSTAPLRIEWTIGATSVVLWACFAGGAITITDAPCPAGDRLPAPSAGVHH